MAKFIKLGKEDFNLFKNDLKSLGRPFELHVNNNSLTLYSGNFIYYTSEVIDSDDVDLFEHHLRFIYSVKKHVEKKIKDKVLVPGKIKKEKIAYFDPGKRKRGVVTNCAEVDIDSAYWETAYKEKIISGKIYRYGKKVPKKVRLIALGVLNKTTTVYKFDGKKLKRDRIEKNIKTGYFWNKICKNVSDIMVTVSSEIPCKDYYFYWVDAIFVSRGQVKKVKGMFNAMGYETKTKEIKKISFSPKEIVVDGRSFSMPGKDNKAKFLENI